MSLADEVAKRLAQERADAARRANPDLEARVDRFIAENPRRYDYFRAMSTDGLVRRLMEEKMERAEAIVARNRELEPWVKEHPEIVAKVARQIKSAALEGRRIVPKMLKAETQNQQRGSRIRM